MTVLNTFPVGFCMGVGTFLTVQWGYQQIQAMLDDFLSFEGFAQGIRFD